MKTTNLSLAAGALIAVCGAISAQTPPAAGMVYREPAVLSLHSSEGGDAFTMSLPALMGTGLFNPETVAGSPFSATHRTHSLQILSNGTMIESGQSQQVYRDSAGRTRIENESPSGASGEIQVTVMIQDPVSGVMALLDPRARSAQKMPAPRMLKPSGASDSAAKPVIEDLAAQNVNGVTATGRRTTLTIATGEIGNDRPIQVVSETWYSSDLRMLVKSSNSDPRSGDTSFELTNISRGEPDPDLFRIPAGYSVSEAKPVQSRTEERKE